MTLPSFVIHEHHATALHWDFRLEHDGVLVSWAVPKGLPTDPKVNRLAVHVDDHALEYASYEGTIGDDRYGAGAVTIWDSGTYITEKWSDREVKIVLNGERVQGRFVLFQTGGNQWMVHRMDGPPRADWLPLPAKVAPMLATDGALPRGPGWAYEMAWTGDRAIARIEGGRIALFGADGANLSARYPQLRALAARMGTTQLLLDGVLTRFGGEPAVYVVVDLLHEDGRSWLTATYDERRAALARLQLDGPAALVPPVLDGPGREAMRISRAQHLAGVLAKRRRSSYQPGQQTNDWIWVSNSS
jgi:bifunctional non-homologous end joining protein LigD